MALISILAIVSVFVVGSFKKIHVHLGMLGMMLTGILALIQGYTNAQIIALFPTTLFLRLVGTMLLFAVAKSNGCFEILAKKLMALLRGRAKLMPFVLFFVGLLTMSGGGAVYAPAALMISIGITIAKEIDGDPLLYGISGAYGCTIGAYLPVGSYNITVISTAETSGIIVNPWTMFLAGVVGYVVALGVAYLVLGGYKAKTSETYVATDVPQLNTKHYVTFVGVVSMFAITMFGPLDLAFVSVIVSIVLSLLGCADGNSVVKDVSLHTIMLVCGMSMLLSFSQNVGGFELVSEALAAIMNKYTAGPLMSLTGSFLSLFMVSAVAAQSLIPTLPGIVSMVPGVTGGALVLSVACGTTATAIGPLSLLGAFIASSVGQTYGEKVASGMFTKQMLMAVMEACVLALISFLGLYTLLL